MWCCVCIVNSYGTLLNWPIVSLLFLFIFFSISFILIHDHALCFSGSPYCKFSYCKFSYYNYISIWPYYIVIHFTILTPHNIPLSHPPFLFLWSLSYPVQGPLSPFHPLSFPSKPPKYLGHHSVILPSTYPLRLAFSLLFWNIIDLLYVVYHLSHHYVIRVCHLPAFLWETLGFDDYELLIHICYIQLDFLGLLDTFQSIIPRGLPFSFQFDCLSS